VNVGEAARGNGNGQRGRVSVAENLGALTLQTFLHPLVNITSHTPPNKSGRNESAGGAGTSVSYPMDGGENMGAEVHRNQRPQTTSRGVAPEQKIPHRNLDQLENRRSQELLHSRAEKLTQSHVHKIHTRNGRRSRRSRRDRRWRSRGQWN